MIPSPHCTVQAQGGKTGEACAPPGDTYTGTQFLPCADTPTHCNCQPVPAIGHVCTNAQQLPAPPLTHHAG